ncbi:TonB-dependent receptor [Iodobacter sp. HSC-16F04]|uniref:TonB-dependent receptor n=1 Tax=Iodobacter violaceini TaxID=3044271 RepID=A0ABX0KMQ2_9NEIS|nr:TonB-dependent receptor [Iodobacter violacea]NHQ84669.1 TonB-dependent receptor [Iodobacter violacea]
MRASCRHAAIRPLILALSLAFAVPAQSIAAQPAAIEFNISAQPLSNALSELARQSGMVLLVDARLTAGRQGPALKGSYSLRDALRQLLSGSGLRAEVNSDGTIVLKQEPQADKAVAIGTVKVSGAAAAFLSDEQIEASDRPYVKPGSSAHISRENIDRFRGTSPADILKGTPGVVVGDARNSGALDVNIRGMQGQGRVPVLIDGSLQASTIYRGYSGIADRSYLDPEMISEINIAKGPSMGAEGAGAIGGLVSMQTLRAEDILKPGERSGFRIRTGLQDNSKEAPTDFETTPRTDRNNILDPRSGFLSLAYATRQDDFDLIAAISHRSTGNYFAGKNGFSSYQNIDENGEDDGITRFYHAGDEVLNTSNTTDSALLKTTLNLTDDQALELSYRYFKSAYGEIMPSQILRNSTGIIKQWKPSEVSTDAWTARYKYQPADNPLISLKANLWHTDMESAARNGDVFRNPHEGKPTSWDHECEQCVETLYLAKNQSQRYGADLSNTSRFDNAYGAFSLNYGFSLQKEDIAPSDRVKIDMDDINHNRTLRSGTRHEESAFLNMLWQPSNWLTVEAGGRYLRYHSKDRNTTATQLEEPQGWKRIYLYDDQSERIGTVLWHQDKNGQFSDATNPLKADKIVLEHDKDEDPVEISRSQVHESTVDDMVYHDDIPGAFSRSAPIEREGSGFAPAFGLTFKLSEHISSYLRYTEGLRMPSLYESTIGFSATFSSPLEPEHSKNWETGISFIKDGVFTAEDKLRLKVAYFNNTTDHYITRVQISGKKAWEQNFSMANIDNFSVSGFELQSSYDRGDFFGELAATLNHKAMICDAKMAGYLRAKAQFIPSMSATPDCSPVGFTSSYVSNMIPPKISTNATFGARLLDQKLTMGMRASYVSGPLNTADKDASWQNASGTAVQIKTLPYSLVDLFASYKISADTQVDMTIDNATDRYYLDPLSLSLMPGPGRTVRMSLGMKF